ncbi:MAG TPA: glutaryl-CoA dehydrogenase Acd [Spirochaetia bacterium]|nr:glutaryl-CoA dehydrogenase Acd [Spirochaetia bacterium]
MDFTLNDDQTAFKELARKFAREEIAPTAADDDLASRFRRDLVKKMGELGFYGCVIPEEYGGNGAGFLAITVVTEEIARVSSALRVSFNTQVMGPALTILKWGNEEQKRKYIPALVEADMLGAFAMTEPNAGSDVGSMKATAVRKGDEYILNGTKTWISNAQFCDLSLVFAYTDPSQRPRGMSCFIVESKSPGFTTLPIKDKLGVHSSPTGEIILDNCRVPAGALLGQEGEGFKICMSMLENTRLSCAAGGLGLAQACLDAAVDYANNRQQFGQPVGRFQMIQEQIARMVVEEEAARLLVYRAAVMKDMGLPNNRETSIAKYAAAQAANHSADEAMKILGAYGYSEEYPVARYYRDAKYYQIVEGTSNIQKWIIGQDALGIRKANR